MAFFPKSKLSSSCLPDAVTHPLSGLLPAYLCAQRTLMSIQKPQCQRPFQPSIQIMIQYSSVMEKFFIIAMKPGGFPGFLSADGHRCGIYTAAFFNKLCQKQAVFSIAVFCTAAKQRENVIPDRSRLSLRTAKLTAPYRPQLYQRTGFRSVIW